jgi:hypothetical protein
VNAAVLMFTACLAGADPVPAAQPYGPVPVVVYGNGRGSSDCCGQASVCGNCDAHQCCLSKIWSKLSCFSLCGNGGGHGCNLCGNGGGHGCNLCGSGHKACAPACPPCPKPVCPPCPKPVCNPCPAPKPVCNPCPKPVCNPCPKPVCNPCPKPVCNPCPKPVCTRVQPDCHTSSCGNGCFLHKCKEKLSGLCGGHGGGCHGGYGTAATPNGCGTTVIPPATAVPVAPGTAVPLGPSVAPKAMPEAPKPQVKFESPYSVVRPSLTTDGSAPRTIDLSPTPF